LALISAFVDSHRNVLLSLIRLHVCIHTFAFVFARFEPFSCNGNPNTHFVHARPQQHSTLKMVFQLKIAQFNVLFGKWRNCKYSEHCVCCAWSPCGVLAHVDDDSLARPFKEARQSTPRHSSHPNQNSNKYVDPFTLFCIQSS
jgi:hypothetical protein